MREPDVYRVYEAGSRFNSYLFLSGEDAMVIDPSSEDMLRRICSLARKSGAGKGNIRIFLTQACRAENCGDLDFNAEKITLFSRDDPYRAAAPEEDVAIPGAGESGLIPWMKVQDGDIFRIGEKVLRVVDLQGCREGLSGLWFAEEKILFSGESIGVGQLPKVDSWDPHVDTLGLQLEVLHRVRKLGPRCVLPACDACIGVGQGDEEGTEECMKVLDAMLAQYCLRILEVYQLIPVRGGIPAEILLQKEEPACGAGVGSCLKYLLYRRYVRQIETREGGLVYERGSLRLTDWSLQEKD